MGDNARLLLRLFRRPASAMSEILDQGSLLLACVAVLAASLLLRLPTVDGEPWFAFRFYTPLLVLAAVYVPGTLVLSKLVARLGGAMGTVFQRDYSPLLTCAAMAWTAANLPLVVAARVLPVAAFPIAAAASAAYFAVLMFFAVRTVFGTENVTAVVVVGLSWIPLVAMVLLWAPLQFLLGWLASPFFLLFAFYFLRNEIDSLGSGLRDRRTYRRMLEAAAVNPHDGEAQYQLGLIYQQRHQYAEAIQRFKNAVAIDPNETDAHFQLGRIASQQKRLKDAREHYQTVLSQDPKHSQSEILRELGALYVAARQYEYAREQLAEYVNRRPYDPEGLYYYGQSLEGSGSDAEARGVYERAIEADRTAPRYRRRFTAKWSRLSQKRIRKLAAQGT